MKKILIVNGYVPTFERHLAQLLGLLQGLGTAEPDGCILLCRSEAEAKDYASRISCDTITVILSETYNPEAVLAVLAPCVEQDALYILGSDYASAELAPRLAARCGGSAAVGAQAMELVEDAPAVWRRVYSNHMDGLFRCEKLPCFAAAAKGAPKAALPNGCAPELKLLCTEAVETDEVITPVSGNGLDTAKILVAGGNGAGGREGLQCLQELAEKLGGAFGVSKPAAMSAWTPLDRMIGISGTICSPALCITAGVSGAAAFYAGVEKSEMIIAINTDSDAPIMRGADVVIQDDYKKVIPALNKLI